MIKTLLVIGFKKLRVFGRGGHVSAEGIICRGQGDLRGRSAVDSGIFMVGFLKVKEGLLEFC